MKTLKLIITSMLLVLTGATAYLAPTGLAAAQGKSGEAKEKSAGGSKGKAKGNAGNSGSAGSAAVDSSGAGSGSADAGAGTQTASATGSKGKSKEAGGTKFSLKSEKDRVANLNSQLKSLNSLKRNEDALRGSSDPKVVAVVTFLENTEDKEVLAKALVLLGDSYAALEADSDALTGEIEDAATDLSQTLADLLGAEDRLAILEGDAAALAEQLASLDASLSGAETTLSTALDEQVEAAGAVDSLSAALDAATADNSDQDLIDQLTAELAEAELSLTNLNTAIEDQQATIASLEEQQATASTSLDDVNDAVALAEGEIADLTLTQTEQEQLLTDLTTAEEALLIELQAALDELEGAQSEFETLEGLTTDDVLVDALVAFLINSGQTVDADGITDEMLAWAKEQLAL